MGHVGGEGGNLRRVPGRRLRGGDIMTVRYACYHGACHHLPGGAHHTTHPDARPVLLLVLRAGPAGGAATRRGARCRRSVSGSSILNKRLDRPLYALDGRLLLARALGSLGWRRRRLRKRVRGLLFGIRGIPSRRHPARPCHRPLPFRRPRPRRRQPRPWRWRPRRSDRGH